MAKFVELTKYDDGKRLLNADRIDLIYEDDDGINLLFNNGDYLKVKESYDEVKKLLGVE